MSCKQSRNKFSNDRKLSKDGNEPHFIGILYFCFYKKIRSPQDEGFKYWRLTDLESYHLYSPGNLSILVLDMWSETVFSLW